MRRAGAADEPIGQQLYRALAGVADRITNREHVVRIDADHACEDQPLPVIPGQSDRAGRSERAARRGPPGLRPRHFDFRGGRDPAEFGEIRILRARRRQQFDLGALRINGFVVIRERQVVEPCSRQVDRAVQPRRRDLDAWLLLERHFAGLDGVRRCSPRRIGRSRGRGSGRLGCRTRRRRRGHRGPARRGGRLRWPHSLERELKRDQDPDREHDRYEKIALFHFLAVGVKGRSRLAYRPEPAREQSKPSGSGTGS